MNLTGIPYKLIGGLVGALVFATALGWLIHSRDHWRAKSQANERLYVAERGAFKQTVTNYRAAAETARKADAANVARVTAEQSAINQRTSNEYEARIADARALAGRLQHQAAASNLSRRGDAPVSVVSQVTSGTLGPAPQSQLSTDDALLATEQAIQLDELIKAVTAQSAVNTNGTK